MILGQMDPLLVIRRVNVQGSLRKCKKYICIWNKADEEMQFAFQPRPDLGDSDLDD